MEPLFFKPIIALDQLVKITATFIDKHLKEEDLTYALLQDREGRLFPVKIEEDRSFGEGWHEFARDHNLKVGNFLIFRHKGSMVFTVDVRDRTTCEREDSPVYARDTVTVEEEESAQPQNVPSNGETPEESTQPQNVPSSGETPFECSSDEQEYRSLTMKLGSSYARGRLLNFPRSFIITNQLEKRLSADVILVDPVGKEFLGLKFSRHPTNNQVCILSGWRDYSITQGLQEGDDITFKLVKNTRKVVKFQLDHDVLLDGSQSEKKSVKEFKCDELNHRNFTIALKPTNISCMLAIPKAFAEKNGLARRGGNIVLQDGKGRSWKVSLSIDTKVTCMRRGWLKVVKDSELKVGDLITFDLIKAEREPVIKFRVLSKS